MATNHQLAAIMFTDIVGYTAMMGKDSTQQILKMAVYLIKFNLTLFKY